MQVLYTPQRSDYSLEYLFEGEKIIVTINGKTDTFDFTDFPDGRLEDIQTSLPINPIVSSERKDGELFVKLLYYHGKDAKQEELFPQWQVIE